MIKQKKIPYIINDSYLEKKNTDSKLQLKMMINKIWKITSQLLFRSKNRIISHKFYFGQGGEMQFDLRNRSYSISIETIWDDYTLLDIQGLSGVSNFSLYQQDGISYFRDEELQLKQTQKIKATLKIPEDYTLRGIINGSIAHSTSSVGKKMRSKPFDLQIIGKDYEMSLGDVKSQSVNLVNLQGLISVPSLTVQTGKINSKIFESKKLMTSNSIEINSSCVGVRSIIMFGKSHGKIICQNLDIQSISGSSQIESTNKLKIERYYGGQKSINIKCKDINDKFGIQTGTGKVEFSSQQQAIDNFSKVKLGKMHKGSLERRRNMILIS